MGHKMRRIQRLVSASDGAQLLVSCRDNEFEQKTKASAKRMNYVSAQLMAGRDKGTHPSYLHRLYAEGLEAFEKKRRQVGSATLHDSSSHAPDDLQSF